MLSISDFPKNPLTVITSEKNRYFAKKLLAQGMKQEKIREILLLFVSYKVPLIEIMKKATNHEWTEYNAYITTVHKHYDNAIKNLNKILGIIKPFSHSDIVVSSVENSTREEVKRDIDYLKKQQAKFVLFKNLLNPLIIPKPDSIHQMIEFQGLALFKYIVPFDREEKPKDVYDFIAELFRNLYNGHIGFDINNLTGDILKKNYIDNTKKLSISKKKILIKEIEKIIS